MKNLNLKTITLILAVILITVLMAAKIPETNKQYEYVSLVQDPGTLRITIGSSKYETIDIRDKIEKWGDYKLLFQKVDEFQALGYEVVENNVFVTTTWSNYILMRRAK